MVVKPEIFAWQKTGSFHVALTQLNFNLTPPLKIDILFPEQPRGKRWLSNVLNAARRIRMIQNSVKSVRLLSPLPLRSL
jgi:hypothetical protein